MSGASKHANGRVNGPVLTSGFLIFLAHRSPKGVFRDNYARKLPERISCLNPVHLFLDAFSHLYKRVCPSLCRSVGRSVGQSVRRSHMSWIFDISTKVEQNNMKHNHLRDNLKTGTWADRQNASYVWTPSDLFLLITLYCFSLRPCQKISNSFTF